MYVWKNSPKYDVINFYHCHKFIRFLCWMAKKANPNIITYVKLDMGSEGFLKEKQQGKKYSAWKSTDLFTVEAQKYVDELNKLAKFSKKVKYLPNGFFYDVGSIAKNIKKDKVILTVGRLETYQKNTEMLVNAFCAIDKEKISDWKLFLVGPMTDEFKVWLDKKIGTNEFYKDKIVITGNIADKEKLYEMYSRASIFVLPSRFEGFPLVIQEALHFSCFPIITDCFAGADEIVKEEYGIIIKNESIEMLIQAIEKVINKYPDCISKGKIAARFVDQNFSWKILGNQLQNYFCLSKDDV